MYYYFNQALSWYIHFIYKTRFSFHGAMIDNEFLQVNKNYKSLAGRFKLYCHTTSIHLLRHSCLFIIGENAKNTLCVVFIVENLLYQTVLLCSLYMFGFLRY